MFQTQLISQVVEWERRLEIEDERRKNHRGEPYVNYLAPVPCRKERRSIFAWVAELFHHEERQPEYRVRCQEPPLTEW